MLEKGVSLRLLFTEGSHILASQFVNAIQAGLRTHGSHNMCKSPHLYQKAQKEPFNASISGSKEMGMDVIEIF